MSVGRWRAMAQGQFAQDTVSLWLAIRDDEGLKFVDPIILQFSEAMGHDEAVTLSDDEQPNPTLILPTEAAQVMLNALAAQLLGGSAADMVQEVHRLRRDLRHERGRVDSLIESLGALGREVKAVSRETGV
jgi:hypothetical protein